MYYRFLRPEEQKCGDTQPSNPTNHGKYSTERHGKRLISLQNYQLPKNPEIEIPCLPSASIRNAFSLQNLKARIPTQKAGVSINMMKNMLNEDYQKQIKQKRQETFKINKLKIMEERDFLSNFQTHRQFEGRKIKKEKEQYKKQLLTQIQEKKIVMDLIKTEQTSIEKIFQQPRQSSLKNKSQAFKRFYEQANKYQNKVQNQYKQYMKIEQIYKKSRNKHKISDYSRNFDLMNRQRHEQIRLERYRKEELKRILNNQIKEKQITKNKIKEVYPRRSVEVIKHSKYDPIVNPIDYKMDINNRNVMGQIIKKKKVNDI